MKRNCRRTIIIVAFLWTFVLFSYTSFIFHFFFSVIIERVVKVGNLTYLETKAKKNWEYGLLVQQIVDCQWKFNFLLRKSVGYLSTRCWICLLLAAMVILTKVLHISHDCHGNQRVTNPGNSFNFANFFLLFAEAKT